jgi:acetylornithine deacetylase/succinyl-diaminopimelate desuccinylase-like protein
MAYIVILAVLAAALIVPAPARAQPHDETARSIYAELIGIDTVTATGDTARAARAMAERLRAAGIPEGDVHVFDPAPRKGNLVARLAGSGRRKPLLLVAHLDVVAARREDWSVDPFVLTERDGYFYGRGSSDDKYMAAAFVANLIRLKKEGFVPDRDIVLALETDEEILDADGLGIRWLLKNHFDLIDAALALNEGGAVSVRDGKPRWNSLQTGEKVSVNFRLEVHSAGGHSAVPTRETAISVLAGGLVRLARFDFPVRLNDTTRAFLRVAAAQETPERAADMRTLADGSAESAATAAAVSHLAADPALNAQLRTTCVATLLEGGQAINALPQRATAKVNCRVLPGEDPAAARETLQRAVDDPRIAVSAISEATLSAPSVPPAELLQAVERLTAEFWPGIPVVPVMSAGATDASHLRNAGIPTFGHSGLAVDAADAHAHGKDERIPVESFYRGVEYLYRLMKELSR